jgi:hypothetical protein
MFTFHVFEKWWLKSRVYEELQINWKEKTQYNAEMTSAIYKGKRQTHTQKYLML